LLKSSWCKSSPARAVAGGPEASVAIRRVTGGCEAYTARTQAMSIQLRNLYIVAMPTPLALRKAASWRTVTARSAAVAGVPSPWHVFIETSREPRRAPCLSAHWGVVYPEDNRTGSAVAAEGHRQKRRSSAAEVICRQGKPEAATTGRRAVLRTHTTCEGGEPQGSGDGRPRYPLEGRGKQVDESMKGCMPGTPISEKHVKWT
jgi:hypothetical protein